MWFAHRAHTFHVGFPRIWWKHVFWSFSNVYKHVEGQTSCLQWFLDIKLRLINIGLFLMDNCHVLSQFQVGMRVSSVFRLEWITLELPSLHKFLYLDGFSQNEHPFQFAHIWICRAFFVIDKDILVPNPPKAILVAQSRSSCIIPPVFWLR